MAFWLAQRKVDMSYVFKVFFEISDFPFGFADCFRISTRCEGESSKSTVTRPYAHADLAAGETKCLIIHCFTAGFKTAYNMEASRQKA